MATYVRSNYATPATVGSSLFTLIPNIQLPSQIDIGGLVSATALNNFVHSHLLSAIPWLIFGGVYTIVNPQIGLSDGSTLTITGSFNVTRTLTSVNVLTLSASGTVSITGTGTGFVRSYGGNTIETVTNTSVAFSATSPVSVVNGALQAVDPSLVSGTFPALVSLINGADTVTGGTQNDTLMGFAGSDVINGNGGNDQIFGGAGNDSIDGGANIDTVYFTGLRSQYTITNSAGVLTVADSVAGRDGTDTLSNVETVVFADGAFAVAAAPGIPVIVSDGGGATGAVGVGENSQVVTTVRATHIDATPALTYSIAGGADAAAFTINSTSGFLSFIAAPNFEAPTDVGLNNVYDVVIRVSDGVLFDDQALAVAVTNVDEINAYPFDEASNYVVLPAGGAWVALGGSDTVIGTGVMDVVDGGEGYDNLYGGAGDDTLAGGALEDIVVGDAGNDTLYGGDGGDVLSELYDPINSGNDIFDGGNGVDIMYSAAGDDIVYGGTDAANNYGSLGDGNDTYFGSAGTDVVVGGAGNDTITGNLGDDSLYGEVGDDTIYGGDGSDLLSGDVGIDSLYGGEGGDLLVGDAGNDILVGGGGIDVLYGGANDDVLRGGAGTDGLFGGSGNDDFQVGGALFDADYIWDFQVNGAAGPSDRLVFQAGHFESVAQVRSHATFASGNTTITVPTSYGATVVLVGVNLAGILDEDIVISGAF